MGIEHFESFWRQRSFITKRWIWAIHVVTTTVNEPIFNIGIANVTFRVDIDSPRILHDRFIR